MNALRTLAVWVVALALAAAISCAAALTGLYVYHSSIAPLRVAVPAVPENQAAFAVLDLDRLMKTSRPGRAIANYVADYGKALDGGIARLDAALAAARRAKDTARADALTEDRRILREQKKKVEDSARAYLRAIVAESLAAAPVPDGMVLIDAGAVWNATVSRDFTPQMAERLESVTPKLPEVPKIAAPAPQKAPAPASGKK